MNPVWDSLFENYGIKTVTKTDKSKGAYLPNAAQLIAIEAAGIVSAKIRPAPGFSVSLMFDNGLQSIEASFYSSERSPAAKRSPEPRMGHEFISSWANSGDKIVIGNVGPSLFAAKVSAVSPSVSDAAANVAKSVDKRTIFDKALKAQGKPEKTIVQRSDFVRNVYVVAAALLRSDGECEMPQCTSNLFSKDDGRPFLEVHHVMPLGEGGDDALSNVAALCPRCHRELHYGKQRQAQKAKLATYVSAASNP